MLENFNLILGIIASIAAILCGVVATNSIKKKNHQKNAGNAFSNQNGGDSFNNEESPINGRDNSVNIIGNNNTIVKNDNSSVGSEQTTKSINLKEACQILFIDDSPLPTLTKTLKRAGWKNIKRIDDTANLDVIDIRNANIIFVDIIGVGLKLGFKNEGIGLAAAIKRKYPQKGVVIYSATPDHDLFDPDLKVIDDKLSKNAEPIQFSYMIEQYGNLIN